MEKEIYKDIPEYEGIYQCSNYGNIKSLKRTVVNSGSKSGFHTVRERILKTHIDKKTGYVMALLSKESTRKNIPVHILVMSSFYNYKSDRSTYIEIHHIDHNRVNNRLDNLEICTKRYNQNEKWFNVKTSSIYPSVTFNQNRYVARITVKGKRIYIGRFITEELAFAAYIKKLESLNEL